MMGGSVRSTTPTNRTNRRKWIAMSYKKIMRNVGMGLCGLLWCALAQAATTLSIGSATAWPVEQGGGYELVPVTLTSGDAVAGLQFDVVYDAANLAPNVASIQNGSALGAHVLSLKADTT